MFEVLFKILRIIPVLKNLINKVSSEDLLNTPNLITIKSEIFYSSKKIEITMFPVQAKVISEKVFEWNLTELNEKEFKVGSKITLIRMIPRLAKPSSVTIFRREMKRYAIKTG